jgi:hypothetical protein
MAMQSVMCAPKLREKYANSNYKPEGQWACDVTLECGKWILAFRSKTMPQFSTMHMAAMPCHRRIHGYKQFGEQYGFHLHGGRPI